MSGELERIAMLARIFERRAPGVMVGIGDDAAVLAKADGNTVVSVDTAVEGVHFMRGWLTPRDIGARSVTAALSDLGAMGATPVACLLALTLPQDISDEFLRQLARGLHATVVSEGCSVIGGNISGGRDLTLSTTVIGESSTAPLMRTGARAGDALCVGGTLGSAALGLSILQGEPAFKDRNADRFIQAWRRPKAQIALGQALLGIASSAVDISDGLLADTRTLARDCGFVIEVDKIPTDPGFHEFAGKAGVDATSLLLSGGEDYRLLFTCAPDDIPTDATQIGSAVSTPGVRAVNAEGQPVSVQRLGYEH